MTLTKNLFVNIVLVGKRVRVIFVYMCICAASEILPLPFGNVKLRRRGLSRICHC